jgi:glycine betaine/choline ABC-type transport system substrate-binding protein
MKPAQFGEPAHTADAGITRVCDLANVVHHLMPVVGAEWDEVIDGLGSFEDRFHRSVHVDITVEMV